ncbi:MAG: DNA polymerase III subunit beta [Phycisphaerae bacterium]
MKFRFNRQELSDALGVIGHVAAPRTTKPMLQCVHIKAHGDYVVLSATDLEVSVRCVATQVEVEQPGVALVGAETFGQIVRECTDELMGVEQDGDLLHMRGAGSHFRVVTKDPAEFPPVPEMEGDADFTVDSTGLHRQVEWTVYAAARENTRYAINGILWERTAGRLTLAGTDGRRLACATGDVKEGEGASDAQAIVPARAMGLLARLPVDPDGQVAVKMMSNQLVLHVGRSTMSTALVEGQFPKYTDVIPDDCDKHVELNTLEFQSALKRAALLTNEESKGVRLSFGEDTLTLSSRAPETGEATISMPLTYKGAPIEIGFNPTFLLDVLRVVHTDTVRFDFRDGARAAVIRLGDDFVYVVMPVNLS